MVAPAELSEPHRTCRFLLSGNRASHQALELLLKDTRFLQNTNFQEAAWEIAQQGFDTGQRDGYDEEGRRIQLVSAWIGCVA